MRKFVTALLLAIALIVGARSVSWGNELGDHFGGTWEGMGDFFGGTWE